MLIGPLFLLLFYFCLDPLSFVSFFSLKKKETKERGAYKLKKAGERGSKQ
jgi:hypothetical protein